MQWRQLQLLLWKSVYLYKLRRNWAITALEVLTPLLLTLVNTYLHCSRDQPSQTAAVTPSVAPIFVGADTEAEHVVKPSLFFPKKIAFVPAPGTCWPSLAGITEWLRHVTFAPVLCAVH
ncbi:uncharacterized protein LOC144130452 [Amblyomma americanum]